MAIPIRLLIVTASLLFDSTQARRFHSGGGGGSTSSTCDDSYVYERSLFFDAFLAGKITDMSVRCRDGNCGPSTGLIVGISVAIGESFLRIGSSRSLQKNPQPH